MNDLETLQMMIKMKEFGITKEQIEEFKVNFRPKEPVLNGDEVLKQMFKEDMTDEEILYYSTPYYDELQAKKELHKQHIKEEEMK